MKHVLVLQAGGVSTDWRSNGPFRTLTSQLLPVAAAATVIQSASQSRFSI
jgi:hypothetical protein